MVFSIAVENESSSGVTLYVKDGEDETVALNMLSKEKIIQFSQVFLNCFS